MNLNELANFEPAEHVSASEPLPAGWYEAKIIETDWRKIRSGEGHYIFLLWQIVSTEHNEANDERQKHAGRRVKEMLNLDNPRPETVDIAKERLARLMNATGVPKLVNGHSSLSGHSCLIRVKLVPARDDYPAKNEVIGYRPAEQPQLNFGQSAPAQKPAPYNENVPF